MVRFVGGIMKRIFVLVILLMSSFFCFGEKVVQLPDLLKPESLTVDDNQFYINEKASVFIYSLKDFNLKKKFGKAGEGPQEFRVQGQLLIVPREKDLLINSFGKLSFFTKDGEFIEEKKVIGGLFTGSFYPLDNGYIGASVTAKDNTAFMTVNLYDFELKKGKEIIGMELLNKAGKIQILSRSLDYKTYQDKVFVVGGQGFQIDVLDNKGDNIVSIKQKYEKLKFTSEDEKRIMEALKKAMPSAQYEALKNRWAFPEYYPEILTLQVSDGKIYALTWKRDNSKFETFIFDFNGKLLATKFIKFALQDAIRPTPFTIYKGQLYQVIENEDEEVWELHINDII
jgi:hypothetical protein